MSGRIIEAPFTLEQVYNLNVFQSSQAMHPFTCENRGDGKHTGGNLVATINGWICPYCDYKQGWAYDFMASGEAVNRHYEMLAALDNQLSGGGE